MALAMTFDKKGFTCEAKTVPKGQTFDSHGHR
jgi:hypothetical protein